MRTAMLDAFQRPCNKFQILRQGTEWTRNFFPQIGSVLFPSGKQAVWRSGHVADEVRIEAEGTMRLRKRPGRRSPVV